MRGRWRAWRDATHAPAHRLWADHPMLDREQRRRRARRDAELGVDVLDVVARGARRDAQLGGDLPVRAPAREQRQDLGLALGEPRREWGAGALAALPHRA